MDKQQMLTLINTNRMKPLIAPIGLDYIASSVQQVGIDIEVLDLGLADDPAEAMKNYFSEKNPELVGVSFRNSDDCFWPSAAWFVPDLKDIIQSMRTMTDAPIVLGGVGFSIFARSIFEYTHADFGIRGDGEQAIVSLMQEVKGKRRFSNVPGLIWQENGKVYTNSPAWPKPISVLTKRDFIDNLTYFKLGGQVGMETKRGCNRCCIYCADPLAKGDKVRLRKPSEVADEVESLLARGINVLHLCDSEFNIPRSHAYAICQEFIKRSLGNKIKWYAYMSPVPFDQELAIAMKRAGCAGINFTGDSGCPLMLQVYRQKHTKDNLAFNVNLCRENGIAVMIDLLIGGPGETVDTVKETIEFIKQINPDCAGAALGVRIYPGTAMEKMVIEALQAGQSSGIRRKYHGHVDLFKPTFYISDALGERPTELVRNLIGGDQRFFEPVELEDRGSKDATGYNYNENLPLIQAIQAGARGAYWDILRQIRKNSAIKSE
jgi:tryptophan 2-C-methyltransferase